MKSKVVCILTASSKPNEFIFENKLGITFKINSKIFFYLWFNSNGVSRKGHGLNSCFNSLSQVFYFSHLKQVQENCSSNLVALGVISVMESTFRELRVTNFRATYLQREISFRKVEEVAVKMSYFKTITKRKGLQFCYSGKWQEYWLLLSQFLIKL